MAKKKTKPDLELGAIKSQVETSFNSRYDLKTRWDTDFDLWRQKPYNAGRGYYSYTSNAPRVLADRMLSLLMTSKMLASIPSAELTPEDRKIAANIERFIYGAINQNDEKRIGMGQPILRQALAWLFLLRGGAARRTFVNKDKDGKTIAEIIPWDLYGTAYGFDGDGIIWAAHQRMASRESILNEYPHLAEKLAPPKGIPKFLGRLFGGNAKTTDDVVVIDYWDREYNGIIVHNDWGKEPEAHGLGKCPVEIVLVGGMPSVLSTDVVTDTEAYRGQSIFDANRQLYPLMNKTMSDYLTLVRRGVKPPIQVASATGDKSLDVDIYGVEKGAVISTELNDLIKPIFQESMPKDAQALLNVIGSEIQRGGLPHTMYGELATRLSGYAISQLQQSLITVLAPFLVAMEQMYQGIANDLIGQFGAGGYEPIEVMGYTSRGEPFGYPTRLKIKSSDLKKDWRPSVKFVAELPKDDASRVQLANILRMGDPPLMSHRMILEEILEVEDPDLALRQIREEWGENIPAIKLQSAFQAYVEAGEFHKARLVLDEINRLQATMEAQLPQGTPTTGGQGVMGGLSPETMPMEQVGGTPPGAANAAPVALEEGI